MPRRVRLYLAIVSLTIAADQASKVWARHLPVDLAGHGVRVPFIGGLWDWYLDYNPGSAFSMFAGADGARIFLSLVGLVAVGAISWMVTRATDDQRGRVAALGLMAGGALGNLADRVRFGKVTDFVLWHYHDHHWPVFNVADVCLSVAVAIFLISSLRGRNKAPAQAA